MAPAYADYCRLVKFPKPIEAWKEAERWKGIDGDKRRVAEMAAEPFCQQPLKVRRITRNRKWRPGKGA